MFNHARTLLINVPYKPTQPAVGDELIDPTFVPKTVPSLLLPVRRAIFGVSPDRTMLNYRAKQLLAMLSSTELQQFVTDLDPRITYDAHRSVFDNPSIYLPTYQLETNGDSAMPDVTILGQSASPRVDGRLQREWFVEIEDDSATVLEDGSRAYGPLSVTYASGLSSAIPLGDSGLSLVVSEETYDPGDGPRIRVRALTRPLRDLGRVHQDIRACGDEVIANLFGRTNALGAQEPFKTFYNLYEEHYALPYKLGGAVLALIYQLNR